MNLTKNSKCYNPQQILLADLAAIFGSGNKTITVSHDPTGDMTGAKFGACHLSFDLADGKVYARGTRFTCKDKTVSWTGRRLRVVKAQPKPARHRRRI